MCTSVTSPMRAKASRTVSPVDENDKLPTYRRVPMSLSSLAYGLECASEALDQVPGIQSTVENPNQAAVAKSAASTRRVTVDRRAAVPKSREQSLPGKRP